MDGHALSIPFQIAKKSSLMYDASTILTLLIYRLTYVYLVSAYYTYHTYILAMWDLLPDAP